MIPVHTALNESYKSIEALIEIVYACEIERQIRNLKKDINWIINNLTSVEEIISLPINRWPNIRTFPKIIISLAIKYHFPLSSKRSVYSLIW